MLWHSQYAYSFYALNHSTYLDCSNMRNILNNTKILNVLLLHCKVHKHCELRAHQKTIQRENRRQNWKNQISTSLNIKFIVESWTIIILQMILKLM